MVRMLKYIAFAITLAPSLAFAETQNTVSLTASQMLPGDSGAFTSTQSSGASANAAGTLYHTYAGAMRFDLTTATGRYAGFAGTSSYGINLGPYLLFRSFLSSNFFTMVSSSTVCPGSASYNWIGMRFRSPFPTNSSQRQDASSTSFFAGGNLDYDPNAGNLITGASIFNLQNLSLDPSPDYALDGLSGASCANGNVKMLASGTDTPLDTRGTFFFGDQTFFYLAGGGNPMAAIGVPDQTLTSGLMDDLANSAFTGLYTAFGSATLQTSAQDKRNVLVFPDSAGTTFSVYTANDLDDPSDRTILGTLSCTNLNSPANGFCSGSLTLNGVTGTGNAVCLVSTATPEWVMACSAQYPSDNRIPVTIIARVPSKALLSVTLDQPYYSVPNTSTTATITATVTNLSGKAVSTMGNPSNPALGLTDDFSNAGAYSGGGDCGSSLAGYASCTVEITYAPDDIGTDFQTFRVAYDDGYYGTVNATARLVGITGLSSINITPSSGTPDAGSTVQYTATATYSDASVQNVTLAVAWSSDDPSIASIDANGVATFHQTGSVNFTTTLGVITDTQGVSPATGGSIQVLGQPDPDSIQGALTGFNNPASIVITSGRMFVVDTTNNRVLIWDTVPTSSDTPADLVLGQPDLDTRTANSEGVVSAHSMSGPTGIATDGTRLVVADTANNRVLIWNTLPTVTEQDADIVLGQTTFATNSNDQGGLSSSSLDDPVGVAIAGTGVNADLIVADRNNNRVLMWDTFPTVSKQAASRVLGQSVFNASSANAGGTVNNNTFSTPYGVSTDGTSLYVADYGNHRVLVWDTMPTTTQQAASRVLGQPNFTTATDNTGGISASTMRNPYSVHINGTYLYVSDYSNYRVLIWTTIPTTDGEAADLVLGQTTFGTRTADQGGIGAATLDSNAGVYVSSGKLYVSDYLNHRILIWNSIPTTNKQAADVVLGQADFSRSEANSVGYPTASTMRNASNIASCNNKLIISDTANHRVLIWNTVPTTDGTAADVVLGQPDFASSTANNPSRSGSTLSSPAGVFCDGTRLFVADRGNHRVLIWNTVPTVNQTAANIVLGQTLLTQGTANQGGLAAGTLNGPRGVYATATHVFVADTGNHRVSVWTSAITTNKQAANFALGQPDLTSNSANAGGGATPSSSTLSSPYMVHGDGTRLFVADYTNQRVLYWTTFPTVSGEAADYVLGQTGFDTQASNQGGRGAATLRNPTGVFADGTSLYISDYTNHRVLIHDTYPTGNKEAADRQIGQLNFTAATANVSGVRATSLNGPMGVYSDASRVFIADYNNYRVTVVSVKAQITISDSPSYSYGDIVVGNTSIKTFTLTNIGAQTATAMGAGTPALSTPFTFVGGTYPGTSGTCGASLAGQASCTINVQFNPTLEAATFTDVARVEYNDGVNDVIAAVSLTGRSVLQSSITFTAGGSYDYGNVTVGSGADYTFTISNASGVTTTLMKQGTPALAAPYAFKDGQYPGTGGTCGTVLTTGSTCTVVLRFSPTSLGLANRTFYLSYYNGSFTSTASIALSGTGN